jgi:hypothetical protein
LARALHNFGELLADLGRRDEALPFSHEAVLTLSPIFFQLPLAHSKNMKIMYEEYIKLAKSLDVEPDGVLVGPIEEAFRNLDG